MQLAAKPATADTHNQSAATSTSGQNDVFSDTSSFIASPVATRGTDVSTHHNNKQPPLSAMSNTKTKQPSNGQESLYNKFNDSVLSRSNELISIMKTLADKIEVNDPQLDALGKEYAEHTDKFNWKTIIELSENIFNDYSKKMEQVTKEFDDLNREFLIWQESAYVMDSEKVSKRLANHEMWLNQKELFLKYQKQELSNSAQLIDNALKNLRADPSN